MNNFILISPWSRVLRDGTYNAKNYPWWDDVIEGLKDEFNIVQIGLDGEKKLVEDVRFNLKLADIAQLIEDCYTWISVDNFLPHLAHLVGDPPKPGIVLWGTSDPNVFGYKENKNLLKSRKYLRKNQFGVWDGVKHDPNVFVSADKVIEAVRG